MDQTDSLDQLAERFEAFRNHLRAVAYRMLGSLADADDAVQESWLRLHRHDISDVANLGGWLTTTVTRICLDMLRARESRCEETVDSRLAGPAPGREQGADPEQAAMLVDSLGLALLVVVELLSPTERLAFVLHDMFAVPFDDIAPIVGRSSTAARQLASRARRRIQSRTAAESEFSCARSTIDAFLFAAWGGDFHPLLVALDPERSRSRHPAGRGKKTPRPARYATLSWPAAGRSWPSGPARCIPAATHSGTPGAGVPGAG